jgi:hypothetical protein
MRLLQEGEGGFCFVDTACAWGGGAAFDVEFSGALPSRFSRVGVFWFLTEFSSSVGGIDADQSFAHERREF